MPTKPPADGLKHTVKEGQWVGNIALMYGFADWEADVWNHDQNSELKSLRKDPHVLAVGDELFIPPWQEKKESCAVEQKHTFKLKTPSETIRVRILDEDGEPVKNAKYTLTLNYEGNGITFKQQNTSTDGEGVMTEVIPSTVRSGVVRIPDAKLEIELDFGLAPLNASEELAIIGAKQRLSATGFFQGEINGEDNIAFHKAVENFQRFCARNKDKGDSSITDPGDIDTELSDKTKEALIKYYGC